MASHTYALHDSDETLKARGAIRISDSEAAEYNKRGYGIFQTVNQFFLDRRKKNLQRINAWALDLDDGTKEEQMAKIKSGLLPTLLIESHRGYQPYWRAVDGTPETWNAIVWDRLIPFYGADKNAKDLCRILRKPGYYHMKDPSHPFLVRKVWDIRVEYSAWEMLSFYPDPKAATREKREFSKAKREAPMPGSFWDNVWNLDCEYALSRLSGSHHVGCETYSFHQNASGTKNIHVNGKTSSCWIDKDGRIGSLDHGGPSVAQWLHWFHKDWRRVVAIIKEVFPQVESQGSLI